MAGRLGRGGGPPLRQSAPFSPESQVLQEGEGELAQERVVVQAAPAPTLEVVQPQLFLELLMQLLAHPARLDRDGQGLECRVGGKVRLGLGGHDGLHHFVAAGVWDEAPWRRNSSPRPTGWWAGRVPTW